MRNVCCTSAGTCKEMVTHDSGANVRLILKWLLKKYVWRCGLDAAYSGFTVRRAVLNVQIAWQTKCIWVTVSLWPCYVELLLWGWYLLLRYLVLSHIIIVESYCISWTIRCACLPAKYCAKFSCFYDLRVNTSLHNLAFEYLDESRYLKNMAIPLISVYLQ